jgi:4-amino-4-deoxy-L-arabinose transferase-like glycosyltransferase
MNPAVRTRSIVAAALILYAVLVVRYTCFGAGGSDSAGYMNGAKLIASGHLTARVTPLDALHLSDEWRDVFTPYSLVPAAAPRMMAPGYPLGFSAHLAAAAAVGGWRRAPFYVSPLMALFCLVLTYWLARELDLPPRWSHLSAIVLAFAPTFIYQEIQPMSDVASAAWYTLSIVAALATRRNARWAAVSGVAFAVAVWVRPGNVVLLPSLLLALRGRLRLIAIATAAAAPLAMIWMIVNRAAYGSPFITGYGSVMYLMSWSHIKAFTLTYSKWMMLLQTPLLFPLCFAVAFDRKLPPWQRALPFAAFLPLFIFYGFSLQDTAWWFTRYLLPSFPLLIVAAMQVLQRLTAGREKLAYALVAVMLITGLYQVQRFGVLGLRFQESGFPHAVQWAEPQLPRDAVVLTQMLGGSFYFYSGRVTARYDQLEADRFARLRAIPPAAAVPWYAVVFEYELPELNRRVPAHWTTIGKTRNVLLLRLDS